MAKLKTERILVKDKNLNYKDDLGLDFKIDINVSQDGEFTCYLPEDVCQKLKDAGISLKMNPKAGRHGRLGFLSANTLPELIIKVKTTCEEYISKEIIEEKVVIRYVVETCCTYVKDGENFWPNGTFTKNFNELGFTDGTKHTSLSFRKPYGFHLFTEVAVKRTYRYKPGQERVFYEDVPESMYKNRPALHWLDKVTANETEGELQEIAYTEEVAEFFVSMYKALFKINEGLKDMVTPDAILSLVKNKTKLLG